MHALVADVLGHDRCAAAGGDVGGVVIQDLGLRFPGFVARQCLFNTVPPVLPEQYEQAGIPPEIPREVRMAADYFRRQGRDADGLAAELDSPDKRRRYIAQFYGSRFWAAPGTFGQEDVEFMTEPFADADKLRASFGIYETALGTRPAAGGAAAVRDEPGADAGSVRAGGPCHPARLPRALRGRLHRADRPVRRARVGSLHAMGAAGRR